MRRFVPAASLARGPRRERLYHFIIWALVIWNLYLQLRSAVGFNCTGLRDYMISSSSSKLMHNEFAMSTAAATFVDPSVATATATPSDFTVCSGCTVSSDTQASQLNASLAEARNSSVGMTSGPGVLNASTKMPAANATAGNWSGSSLFAQTTSIPATNISSTGQSVGQPTPPGLSLPKGFVKGMECQSTYKGDSPTTNCMGFCQARYTRAHCSRCKCRSCDFCWPTAARVSGASDLLALSTSEVPNTTHVAKKMSPT